MCIMEVPCIIAKYCLTNSFQSVKFVYTYSVSKIDKIALFFKLYQVYIRSRYLNMCS